MGLHSLHLQDFILPVPLCSGAEKVGAAVASCKRMGSDGLILVDAQQRPQGFIALAHLLTGSFNSDIEEPDAASVPLLSDLSHSNLKDLAATVATSVDCLSVDQSITDVLRSVWQSDPAIWVVTNSAGECLGILDCHRLLQAMAILLLESAQEEAVTQTNFLTAPWLEMPRQQGLTGQQQQIWHLTQQLLLQKAATAALENSDQFPTALSQIFSLAPTREGAPSDQPNPLIATQAGALPDTISVEPLCAFLDCLPLPLMLQTNHGEVIAQNAVWQQQLGGLQYPDEVHQNAARLLDWSAPSASPSAASGGAIDEPTRHLTGSGSHSSEVSAWPQRQAAPTDFPHLPEASRCEVGHQPNSCFCTCLLQDGQEHIFQFVKVSLGALPRIMHNPGQSPQDMPHSEASNPQSFRLATLQPQSVAKPISVTSAGGPENQTDLQRNQSRSDANTPNTPIPSSADIATASLQSSPIASQASTISPTSRIPIGQQTDTLWLILAQDVTEQRQLARELTAKNADLMQLNRLKDEFLACISHELKTPLTAVLGLSSLLKDQSLGSLNQRQVHYAQLIYQSGRHLMAVVNDILDLTRIETGQLDLTFAPVEIAPLCQRVLEQAKQQWMQEQKRQVADLEPVVDIEIGLEIEPGLITLVADEMRLRQMLSNLLSNALKFTSVGGDVGLKVGWWGGWIAFTVWDTGIGIATDKQHLIFQKFQQLESPLTRQFEGTGLGLVLTQRLARLHGGDITFLSTEGKGSRFTILLPPSPPEKTPLTRGEAGLGEDADDLLNRPDDRIPLQSPPTAATGSPDQANLLLTGNRNQLVLLVETAPVAIESLSDELTALGYYRVVVARNGTEALEKARRLQPCIIFLNPLLPLLSGWDVLTLLKSDQETRQIPVVVTATSADETIAQSRNADGFLAIPVQTKPLKSLLRKLLTPMQPSASGQASPKYLTVLHLWVDSPANSALDWSIAHGRMARSSLNMLLQSHRYRILQADDLEQAELLAWVWTPNVVLLDGETANWPGYFLHLSQQPILASLPLIVLEAEAFQAANQFSGLRVFPYLAPVNFPEDEKTSTLLQVIQIAAGYGWQPTILAVDLANLLQLDSQSMFPSAANQVPFAESEWLKALTQYLQLAGLRGLISHSWQETLDHVRSQQVDLLLICWTSSTLQADISPYLTNLKELPHCPPILVLDHRSDSIVPAAALPRSLPDPLPAIADRILPSSCPMPDLLEEIEQLLHSPINSL